MSRETDFSTRIAANAPIMAILTGGVYVYGALPPEGITRETVPAAFDADGYLKPLAVVKMRMLVADGEVEDLLDQDASTRQVVELWLYQDRLYDKIDLALPLLKALFHGYKFTDSFPVEWAGNPVTRGRDEGTLKGASMARQDWLVSNVE